MYGSLQTGMGKYFKNVKVNAHIITYFLFLKKLEKEGNAYSCYRNLTLRDLLLVYSSCIVKAFKNTLETSKTLVFLCSVIWLSMFLKKGIHRFSLEYSVVIQEIIRTALTTRIFFVIYMSGRYLHVPEYGGHAICNFVGKLLATLIFCLFRRTVGRWIQI